MGTFVDGTPYIYPVLTPRFAIATTDELLGQLRDLADSDPSLTIQTHISENHEEVKEVKSLFAHLSTPNESITYAGVYDHYHLLRDNTILAHAIHLEEEELKLIKKKEAAVSHCPTSNFNLTSGVAKIGDMLDRGIKVGFTPFSLGSLPSTSDSATSIGRPRNRRQWWIRAFNPHNHSARVFCGQGRGIHIASWGSGLFRVKTAEDSHFVLACYARGCGGLQPETQDWESGSWQIV